MAARKRRIFVPPSYDPPPVVPAPAPQAPTVAGDALDCEVFSQTYPFGTAARLIFSTKRRWRGVDVYVSSDRTDSPVLVTVRVYAVVGDVRSLVSTGRYAARPSGNPYVSGRYTAPPSKWTAAARCGAVRFEVTVGFHFTGATADPGNFTVACIAADDLIEPPADLGHINVHASPAFEAGPGGFGGSDFQDVELLSIWGSNPGPGTAPIWAMLFDMPSATAGPADGDSPDLVWPLSLADVGSGFRHEGINYRQQQGKLVLRTSLTPFLLTQTGDGQMFAKIR